MPEPAVSDLREILRALPKTELHLHALGAMRPDTIVALARRTGAPILPAAERAADEGFRFEDLSAFVDFFIGLFAIVLDGDAFARVTYEALEDAGRAGARHVELRFGAWSHLSRGADETTMFEAIRSARAEAEARLDVTSRVILTFPRTLPLDVAETTLDLAMRRREAGVVGIDIAGDEQAVQADPVFAPVFRRARETGLGVTAHAGEGAGPESVEGALDRYGVRRIGHGTRSVEDPALVRRLARDGVVLEVCPTSNVALGVVPSIAEHPVRELVRAGVACVLSTDDPTLFGTDLLEEHVRLHEDAGVTLAELGRMAETAARAAFVGDGPDAEALGARLRGLRGAVSSWRRAYT